MLAVLRSSLGTIGHLKFPARAYGNSKNLVTKIFWMLQMEESIHLDPKERQAKTLFTFW